MDYFSKLQQLLHLERKEDRRQYNVLLEKYSVTERRANGISWYPVAIRDIEYTRGDYIAVELERTTHQDIFHQLRFGSSAALFSNHNAGEDRIVGTISHQSGNKLKLAIRMEELPDWAKEGKLGVDLLFDENSYEEMSGALTRAATTSEEAVSGQLVQVLTGTRLPEFHKERVSEILEEPARMLHPLTHEHQLFSALNASQQDAVDKILTAEHLAIIHGPPGTGKTTTVVQAIKALLQAGNKQILVVAPSNTAVDLLSDKLHDAGLEVVRIGNPVKVSERLMSLTLDFKVGEHKAIKEIRRLKKQAAAFKDMAHKYKRSFGQAERAQRKALFDEARKILREVEQTEQYIIKDVLDKAQVVTATLVGASHYTIRHLQYDTVVIDEAGQALEPACWIPILKAKKLVLAGDHCQLAPTIKSNEAAVAGLATTLLEKLVTQYPAAVTVLDVQYRMHKQIMEYPSTTFYKGVLKAADSVATHTVFEGDKPLQFIDTSGCGFEEIVEGTRICNKEEAAFTIKHFLQYTEMLTGDNRKSFPTVAIISPYKAQVLLLQDLLQDTMGKIDDDRQISVNTIDSFQGQERDIVYISMTRSNTDNIIGFLGDIRRMNVAMTRAKKKLVIIGDSATLSRHPFYENLIAYAQEKEAYQSAWQFSDLF